MSRFDVPDDLKNDPVKIRVTSTFNGLIERADTSRSVTPGNTKNYFEFCELLKTALDDYQERLKATNKVNLVWEKPDKLTLVQKSDLISIGLVRRQPGQLDQGAPFEGTVKQLKPLIRETKPDPDAPGYRKVIMGKWHDNLMKFTCWSQTNKEAITRAFWFEEFMDKYAWFFRASGVGRVIYSGQEEDEVINNDGDKVYGRPILYFVRTEELTEYSEKEIEEIYLNLVVNK